MKKNAPLVTAWVSFLLFAPLLTHPRDTCLIVAEALLPALRYVRKQLAESFSCRSIISNLKTRRMMIPRLNPVSPTPAVMRDPLVMFARSKGNP